MENTGTDQGSAGDGEDPSPDDAAGNAPANSGEATGGADTDNRAGDGVGAADGNAEDGVGDKCKPARGFCGKAAEWCELGDALAHRLDNAPAAGHRAAAHGEVAADNHPVGDGKRFQKTACNECCGDEAHALLGVIRAVAETE